jgi:hypothetical protein
MNAFGLVSKGLATASLVGMLAACSSTGSKGGLDLGSLTKSPAAPPPVVQGDCPRIVLRDGTAYHDVYLPGAKALPDGSKDQAKLMYQASIANTTRQCRVTDQGMVITVQVAGRIVIGQAGAKGNVKLPIRVAVSDGATALYSELTSFETPLPVNEPSNQFLFTKDDVRIPAGAGISTIYVGFDDGPVAKPKGKKK